MDMGRFEANEALMKHEKSPLRCNSYRLRFGPFGLGSPKDLDIRRGEIYALLGHNGAGKTTCINCVVGLIPMTSGEAFVNGYDVHTDLERVRQNISVCPQVCLSHLKSRGV